MTKSIGKTCLVFALLFGILVCFFAYTTKTRTEERDSYQQQLIALCGMVKEAITEAGINGYDFSIHPHHKGYSRKGTLVIVHIKEKLIFELYDDGIVKVHRLDGQREEITEKTWKDYPEFYSIGKK